MCPGKAAKGATEPATQLKTAEEFLTELLTFKKEDLNNVEGKQKDSVKYGEPGWKERSPPAPPRPGAAHWTCRGLGTGRPVLQPSPTSAQEGVPLQRSPGP